MKYLIATFSIFLLVACTGSDSTKETESDAVNIEDARTTGRQITTLAQTALISQLGRALAEGDAAHAVQFCNLEASAIVDSINQANNCTVQRLTTRRRNPANKIETRQDRIAWNAFRTSTMDNQARDTVLVEPGAQAVYYKPIFIASELCLQCHGSRSQDIELSTLEKVSELYPADAAVNYHLGDLRGIWKISF